MSSTLDQTKDDVEPKVERLIDREIFVWPCRGVLRKSDPMAVHRRIAEAADALGIDPAAATADLKIATAELGSETDEDKRKDQLAAHRAHGHLAALAKAGFQLKSIEEDEENGWTEAELNALLGRFWTWCEDLKKNTAGSST